MSKMFNIIEKISNKLLISSFYIWSFAIVLAIFAFFIDNYFIKEQSILFSFIAFTLALSVICHRFSESYKKENEDISSIYLLLSQNLSMSTILLFASYLAIFISDKLPDKMTSGILFFLIIFIILFGLGCSLFVISTFKFFILQFQNSRKLVNEKNKK